MAASTFMQMNFHTLLWIYDEGLGGGLIGRGESSQDAQVYIVRVESRKARGILKERESCSRWALFLEGNLCPRDKIDVSSSHFPHRDSRQIRAPHA